MWKQLCKLCFKLLWNMQGRVFSIRQHCFKMHFSLSKWTQKVFYCQRCICI
ncbi:unnamed protein product [Paramecium octaurelia]|uniref:Uncharacterized protein n=1 Tax=Paramecium octaurelia TaxID=43137 RepID=A0A8S1UG39_PAROT|nr:unnamed protein product [Paramecium octaurelia]